ncbi:MAG: DUF5685 family protein [Clostridia bacterium]|nr:DUF5685 family protein [Clostridia bacterium]
MFGYVTADKPNMLIKDYAVFRAYYCGMCKAIAKRTKSQLMRIGINYDITFLAILAHNYCKTQPDIQESRCAFHLLGKKYPIVGKNDIMLRIADINTLLAYYKVEDDVLDGGKLKHRLGKLMTKRHYKRAARRMPTLAASIKSNYERLRALEQNKEESIDRLADCFATMLVEVGRAACNGPDPLLDDLCYNLGRWIYLIDAYDDLYADIQEGKFNPLLPSGDLTAETEEQITDTVKFNLSLAVSNIRAAYDAMEITVSEGALSNIIYRGLQARTEEILARRGKECKKTLL